MPARSQPPARSGQDRALRRSAEPEVRELVQALDALNPSLVEAMGQIVRVGDRPIRTAFLARALHALAQLTPRLAEEALARATGAASEYAVLLTVLEEPEALAQEAGAQLHKARLRGLEMRKQLLEAEGGPLTARQVAEHLGITRQAVDKRRQAGKLLAVDIGRHGYIYPAWQLSPEGLLPGLEAVLGALNTAEPWMRLAFFLTGDPRLNGAPPLDALRRGNVEAVCRAARAYGEHAAA